MTRDSLSARRVHSPLRAIGGAPLRGDKWVRVLYLDESGTGNISKEPHLIVAGALINGDRQWRPLKERLHAILEDSVPSGQPMPKCLHAVDIFHGVEEFPREHWPETLRHGMLDQIAAIPNEYQIPIVWGLADRVAHAKQHPEDSPLQHLIDCYSIAALICFLQAEWYMRNRVGPDEFASITIEQNTGLQKRIGEVFRQAANAKWVKEQFSDNPGTLELLPLGRLIDEPSYQPKTSASALQLADYCAFAFKRASLRQFQYERFAKPLAPSTLNWNPGQNPLIGGGLWRLGI